MAGKRTCKRYHSVLLCLTQSVPLNAAVSLSLSTVVSGGHVDHVGSLHAMGQQAPRTYSIHPNTLSFPTNFLGYNAPTDSDPDPTEFALQTMFAGSHEWTYTCTNINMIHLFRSYAIVLIVMETMLVLYLFVPLFKRSGFKVFCMHENAEVIHTPHYTSFTAALTAIITTSFAPTLTSKLYRLTISVYSWASRVEGAQEEVLRVRYIERFLQKSVMAIVITFLALIALWIHESAKVHQYNESWMRVRVESKKQLAIFGAEYAAFAGQYAVELLDAARRSVTPWPYILPTRLRSATIFIFVCRTLRLQASQFVVFSSRSFSVTLADNLVTPL